MRPMRILSATKPETMSTETRRFTGEYAADGKARRLALRQSVDHRCIRCHHRFESGKHGKGEWSPCDERCRHGGPFRVDGLSVVSPTWTSRELVDAGLKVEAQWRILTVHHLDGDKANDAWWNTLSLCQRCHLQIQTRVDPHIPYFLEHADWFKPYVAGFYAHKYEERMITREEAESEIERLLAYECKI